MADVFEQNLPSKANLTTSDYIRVVGVDNASYKQSISDVMSDIGLKKCDAGYIQGDDIPTESTADYNVTYSVSFSSTPTPVASFVSTSTASGFGKCSLSILNRSATGFTIRVYNGDTTQRSPSLTWVAVG